MAEITKGIPETFKIEGADDKNMNFALNSAIKKVTVDIKERFNFNTAISAIMELVNEMYRYKELDDINLGLLASATDKLVRMLSPFVPHLAEELWKGLGHPESIYAESWPTYDETALAKDTVEIVLQINGKVKEHIDVASGLSKDEFTEVVMGNDKVQEAIANKEIIKIIAVPDKLLNIVIKMN